MPRSHLPAATSRAVSRSPPDGRCAEIGLQAAQPLLGLRLAVLDDVGREQRGVVIVLAGADADLAFPVRRWRGPRSSARSASRAPSRRRRCARASRRAYQWPSGSRYCGATTLSSTLGLDRLGDAGAHRLFEPADVDGEQHVGRAVGAFGLDALLEAVGGGDDVDLDAGVLGEGVEQRLDQLGLAIGVDVDLAGLRERGAGTARMAAAARDGALQKSSAAFMDCSSTACRAARAGARACCGLHR